VSSLRDAFCLITIRLIPTLDGWPGWRWALSFLTIGPALGVWAMYRYRGCRKQNLWLGESDILNP